MPTATTHYISIHSNAVSSAWKAKKTKTHPRPLSLPTGLSLVDNEQIRDIEVEQFLVYHEKVSYIITRLKYCMFTAKPGSPSFGVLLQ